MGENLFRAYISVPEKARYSRGLDRPKVDCLLCAMVRKDSQVETKILFEDAENMIVLNRFPYNAGHLLVFPKKHVEKLAELDDRSLASFFKLVKKSSALIEKAYTPQGMNIGINQGRAAGASVGHLHVHVVPRYASETGFMEVLAGSRVIHETLDDALKRLKAHVDLLK
jgi:diadenosine tetraphosphate (Ap4A) HIT family hydrolase